MGPTRINTILQSAFFELPKIIPADKANELMKAAAKATYGRKGEDVVMKNWAAIDAGAKGLVEVHVPESWKNCEDEGLDMVHATEGREDVINLSLIHIFKWISSPEPCTGSDAWNPHRCVW